MIRDQLRLRHNLLRNRVATNLSVMSSDKLLNLEQSGVAFLQLLYHVWHYFSDRIQHILPHVLVTESLKDISRKLFSFELRCMNEVAVVTSGAPLRPMIVLARYCPVVSNLDLSECHLLLSLLLLCL